MKRSLFLVVFSFILTGITFAQTQEPPERKKSLVTGTNIPKTTTITKKAIPYPDIREADVVWSRKIWRLIDLREKMNHPLYFPTIEMVSRKSFVQSLVEGVEKGEITAYGTADEDFTSELKPEDLRAQFGAADETRVVEKMDGTGDTTIVIHGSFNWGDVRELLITEEWFFDRRYSQVFVRIVGLCPILVYQKRYTTEDGDDEVVNEHSKKQLFWLYYPDIRDYLAKTPCFTPGNESAAFSFDDLFQQRRFSSVIVSDGAAINGNRIDDYTSSGLESMLESQRIERELFNKEHDLWEY